MQALKLHQPLPPEDLGAIIGLTRDLWEELRGKKLFVTGGTGFVGSWLVESFIQANRSLNLDAKAVILTRNVESALAINPHLRDSPEISFVQGDVRNFEFPEGNFPFVIHSAADVASRQVSQKDLLDVLIEGTKRVLQFSKVSGTKKMLYISSGAVYGQLPFESPPVSEDSRCGPDPLSPSAAYGEGKRIAELLCYLHTNQSELQCKIARCFAFAGPRIPLDGSFAIGNFVLDAILQRRITIKGSGGDKRSFLYASDLAVWLWTILINGEPLRAYNVGSSAGLTIHELAKSVGAVLGQPGIRFEPASSECNTPSSYVPDVTRAHRELGLAETVPLADAIVRMGNWCRAAEV